MPMSVHAIVAEIESLRPFPQTAYRLIELVADETRALSDVAGVVKMDANLAANILKLANAACFGLKQQVASIDRAVMLLGGQMILEIALFSVTAHPFRAAQEGYRLQTGELWRHSVISAVFAREIAKHFQLKSADVVFTAALIKDIGKVILNRHLAAVTQEIDDLIRSSACPFYEAEKSVLGIDHAELGAMIFEKWNFPESLVSIVRNHHLQKTPVIAPRETCTVYLGDTVCSTFGIGAGKDGLRYPFCQDVVNRYFDIGAYQNLVASLWIRMKNMQELITML